MNNESELPVIQKVYDFIKWYVPILNRLPRDHRFTLGERIIQQLYDLLENCIDAKFTKNKLEILQTSNRKLNILRYQTRLLFDFQLIDAKRYEYTAKQIDQIGVDLHSWLEQQQHRTQHPS